MNGQLGISIYPDLMSFREIKEMIDLAKEMNYQRVFLSMILNNLNFRNAKNPDDPSFVQAIAYCKESGLNPYVDIDLPTVVYLGGMDKALCYLKEIGVYCVRVDGGLTIEELCSISTHPSGLKMQINCADYNPKYEENQDMQNVLGYIREHGDISKVEACFNFYPRLDTGLSEEDVALRCRELKKMKVDVSGFIASVSGPSLLHQHSIGNPTIEKLRYADSYVATKIMQLLGVNHVYFGDAVVQKEELERAKMAMDEDIIRLNADFETNVDDAVIQQICNRKLQNRVDEPEYVIRCTDTRGIHVPPGQPQERAYADITIDNSLSAQYEGEVQIMLSNRDRFDCCNTIGKIQEDYRLLLPYAKQSRYQFMLLEGRKEKSND